LLHLQVVEKQAWDVEILCHLAHKRAQFRTLDLEVESSTVNF